MYQKPFYPNINSRKIVISIPEGLNNYEAQKQELNKVIDRITYDPPTLHIRFSDEEYAYDWVPLSCSKYGQDFFWIDKELEQLVIEYLLNN